MTAALGAQHLPPALLDPEPRERSLAGGSLAPSAQPVINRQARDCRMCLHLWPVRPPQEVPGPPNANRAQVGHGLA